MPKNSKKKKITKKRKVTKPKRSDEEIIVWGSEIAQQAYSEDYLQDLCRKIGIVNERKKQNFCKRVLYSGGRYVDLKRMNAGRTRPHVQNKMLDRYKKALELAQLEYKAIQNDAAASGKLGKAIRKKYKETTEPGMQDMFYPYCDKSGMAITLFEKFLGVLADAAEDAKHQDVGNDKASLSGEFFTGWITAIAKAWPKDAGIKFVVGQHYKETKGYKSHAIDLLHEIVCKIEPDTTRKKIENSVRIIKRKRFVNKPLATFFLG